MLADTPIFHSNRYHADASCEHCAGLVRHEDCCVIRNERVDYAYEVAVRPGKLDYAGQLILHALSVQMDLVRTFAAAALFGLTSAQ